MRARTLPARRRGRAGAREQRLQLGCQCLAARRQQQQRPRRRQQRPALGLQPDQARRLLGRQARAQPPRAQHLHLPPGAALYTWRRPWLFQAHVQRTPQKWRLSVPLALRTHQVLLGCADLPAGPNGWLLKGRARHAHGRVSLVPCWRGARPAKQTGEGSYRHASRHCDWPPVSSQAMMLAMLHTLTNGTHVVSGRVPVRRRGRRWRARAARSPAHAGPRRPARPPGRRRRLQQ